MPTSRFVRDSISRKWLKPPVFLSKINIMFICFNLLFNIVCQLVELFKALRLHIMFYFMLPFGIFVWDMEVKSTIAPLYSDRLESQTQPNQTMVEATTHCYAWRQQKTRHLGILRGIPKTQRVLGSTNKILNDIYWCSLMEAECPIISMETFFCCCLEP